jgi:predicted O-linked N-acetylglucosamine transferase (SPINDLY family)
LTQLLEEADGLSRSGRPDYALSIYDHILANYPRHAVAHRNRGNALADLGHLEQALVSFEKAIALDPRDAECHDFRGIALAQMGRMAEAADSLDRAIALQPGNANALGNRGIVLMHLDRLDEALASFDGAIALYPQHLAAYVNRGNVLIKLKRPDEAIASYDRALALDPSNVDALYNRGLALADAARFDEAVASYDRVLALAPGHVEALNNRGIALASLERHEEAFDSYQRALALAPDHPPTLYNRAEVLYQFGRIEEAERDYARVTAIEPGHIQARFRHAVTLTDLKRLEEAAAQYQQLLALAPEMGHAFNNLALVLRALGHHEQALVFCERAVKLIPASAELWLNLAGTRADLGDPQAALADCDRALALDPDIAGGAAMRLMTAFDICEWREADEWLERARQQIAAGILGANPFQLLALADDPVLHRACAETAIRTRCPTAATPVAARYPRHERIRIGYFSADFFGHATMRLMAEMFEAHDRARFELIGFEFGPEQRDIWRARAEAAMDRFIDVRAMSDRAVAELARSLEVDIAIDLKGFTKHDRMEIFAERAAPVQATFLGFPGTNGAEFFDYVIADPIVIPDGSEQFYTEKVVRLPGSYQPNCREIDVSPATPNRAETGLPEDAIVYCCLNQNYKVTPPIFERWMRILSRVEGSVLWLWVDREPAKANLRDHAAAAGVDPNRLVFAAKLPTEAHYARLPLADLSLDTRPYGAHTTASDALRMGLPVLTAPGASFASRVAASLLHTIGMPELVVPGLDEYEERAVELGRDRAALAAIKRKLAAATVSSTLFDPTDFARKLEWGFVDMYERCQAGLAPDHITVRS